MSMMQVALTTLAVFAIPVALITGTLGGGLLLLGRRGDRADGGR
ncbi:hypothetical protein ACE7GA_07070 [Roseomonas sp. CCTCC AB2023176]